MGDGRDRLRMPIVTSFSLDALFANMRKQKERQEAHIMGRTGEESSHKAIKKAKSTVLSS